MLSSPRPTATVIPFPAVAAEPARHAAPARARCGLPYIADRAGRAGVSLPTLVRFVRALVAEHDFPAPCTPRIWRGARHTGASAVCAGALWYRGPVDDWFDGSIPPEQLARLAEQEGRDTIDAAAATLDARAAVLGARA